MGGISRYILVLCGNGYWDLDVRGSEGGGVLEGWRVWKICKIMNSYKFYEHCFQMKYKHICLMIFIFQPLLNEDSK